MDCGHVGIFVFTFSSEPTSPNPEALTMSKSRRKVSSRRCRRWYTWLGRCMLLLRMSRVSHVSGRRRRSPVVLLFTFVTSCIGSLHYLKTIQNNLPSNFRKCRHPGTAFSPSIAPSGGVHVTWQDGATRAELFIPHKNRNTLQLADSFIRMELLCFHSEIVHPCIPCTSPRTILD